MSESGVKSHAEFRPHRREFLSAGLIGLTHKSERRVEGAIVDHSHLNGHKLRDHAGFSASLQEVRVPLIVVGGGVAGLSAAWHLDKRGFHDFVVLELEKGAGGNSRWGQNEVSAYPWAAHYLPVPNRKATLVRELCEEAGLMIDGHFEERHLCHSPQERLFLHGRWQEGLEPESGVSKEHREQIRRFEQHMREFSQTGEFTIPIEIGARNAGLDRLSMQDWLRQHEFTSPYLNWYVDYACRDDYGAHARDTSAWAGIHYFAAREHDERGPFTWPEGNGYLVKHLLRRVGKYLRTAAMVVRVERDKRGFRVCTESTAFRAQAVIWAAPTFLLPYVFSDAPPQARELIYSPWLTANLTLDRLPVERHAPLAWDNVIYDSPSLGYVVATHQSLRSRIDKSVWTYYHAFAGGRPADNRRMLLEKDWGHWKETILQDLERGHPDIRQFVSRIDVMRFGHAMIRPVVGSMFRQNRKHLADWGDSLVLANSDVSGISIFEEAQYRGVRAAERILRRLGRA